MTLQFISKLGSMRSFHGTSLLSSVLYILTVYQVQCQLPSVCSKDRKEGRGFYLLESRNDRAGGPEALGSLVNHPVRDEALCCNNCSASSKCIAYEYNKKLQVCWTATDAGTATYRSDAVISYLKSDKFKHYTVTMRTGDQGSDSFKYIRITGKGGKQTRQSSWMANDPKGGEFMPGSVDVFKFYLEDVGQPVSVTVNNCYYDTEGVDEPWKLNSVDIQVEGDLTIYPFYFDHLFPGNKPDDCTAFSSDITKPKTTNQPPPTNKPPQPRPTNKPPQPQPVPVPPERQPAVPPERQGGGEDKRSSEGPDGDATSSFPVWAIILVVVAAILVLVALVIAVTKMKKGKGAPVHKADSDKAPGSAEREIRTKDLFEPQSKTVDDGSSTMS